MDEIWKDIEGFEGIYQVSNMGRVRSLDRYIKCGSGVRLMKGQIMLPILKKDGYYQVALWKNGGKPKWCTVHRLVAQAFIPNPDCKPQIDHVNTIKTDNRVENLRWATQEENNRNPITLGKYVKSHLNPIVQMDSKGFFKNLYRSCANAEKLNCFGDATVCRWVKGINSPKNGDQWKELSNIEFMGDLPVVGRCSYLTMEDGSTVNLM